MLSPHCGHLSANCLKMVFLAELGFPNFMSLNTFIFKDAHSPNVQCVLLLLKTFVLSEDRDPYYYSYGWQKDVD